MTPRGFADLHAASFQDERAWSADEFASLMRDAGVFALGDVRSAVLGRVVLDEAEVLTLATAPGHRRQGLGAHVLTLFEAESRARGAAHAFLEVRATNRPAQALYAAQGYAETGRRKGYYRSAQGARVDAILLGKALT